MTKAFPVVPTDPGVTRQVLAEHADLMVVSFRFEAGAEGRRHNHPHVQSTYVRSGRFCFSLGDNEVEIGPGESLVVPPNEVHGCVCLQAGELIDCFSPRRSDFL